MIKKKERIRRQHAAQRLHAARLRDGALSCSEARRAEVLYYNNARRCDGAAVAASDQGMFAPRGPKPAGVGKWAAFGFETSTSSFGGYSGKGKYGGFSSEDARKQREQHQPPDERLGDLLGEEMLAEQRHHLADFHHRAL